MASPQFVLGPGDTGMETQPVQPQTPNSFPPAWNQPAQTSSNPYGSFAQGIKDLTAQSQYRATTGSFDESKGAAGRVNSITSSASPLMTAARTRARQQMVGSGLQNSTMAGQAGEQAVIETATPLAQTDAGLYSNQQLANQQSLNDAARANAQMTGTIGMKGMDLNQSQNQFDTQLKENTRQFDVNQAGVNDRFKSELTQQNDQFATTQAGLNDRFNRELDSKENLARVAQEHDIVMAGLDRDTRIAITELQGKNQMAISSNQDITNAWGTMMQGIDRIQNNPDLDPGTKDVLIANEMAGFSSFTAFWQKASGGTVDVSDLLNFGIVGTGTGTPSQPGGGNNGGGNGYWQPGGSGTGASDGAGGGGGAAGGNGGVGVGGGTNGDGSGVGDGSDGGW